ncbi:hypothetical protein LTR56_017202 [Elasticomyces elasticus]|nr:hypothetical protein LTR56_017202 [Elasticomyces elasticus]KAK3666318.1 hypothetical protein LTR22_002982 [Elasticomyces elasticus]KAK4926914.1 hypothetical protein LTR49_006330 [Elasticomyces elasticus]
MLNPREPSRRPSFDKIRLTCEQARAHGLRYAWVDTCCINKQSSAELSEAINSMFLWYSGAQICFALLPDVELRKGDRGRERSRDDTTMKIPDHAMETFKSSRWFTRGWTLQELIAPQELIFFDRNWALVSDKSSCLGTLCKITGIPAEAIAWSEDLGLEFEHYSSRTGLLRRVLGHFSIAERMSWAAYRHATRLEDVAYSLFGLFDINLPLLYGEGRKAFIRLQKEIVRVSTDDSILAWQYGPDGKTEHHTDELFAGKPSHFCLGARQGIAAGAKHWHVRSKTACVVTNEGLQVTVPFVTNFDGSNWAVLNCGLAEDLTGPLALRLAVDMQMPDPQYYVVRPEQRLNTIPLEILANIAPISITLLSETEGRQRLDERPALQDVRFRVCLYNEGRKTEVIEVDGTRIKELRQRNFQPKQDSEASAPRYANVPPQDITLSIAGWESAWASGVRLLVEKPMRRASSKVKSSEPEYAIWNVAFHVRKDQARQDISNPSSRYFTWIVIEPGDIDLKRICMLIRGSSTARPHEIYHHSAVAVGQGMRVEASILPCAARTKYWQVDIMFTSAEAPRHGLQGGRAIPMPLTGSQDLEPDPLTRSIHPSKASASPGASAEPYEDSRLSGHRRPDQVFQSETSMASLTGKVTSTSQTATVAHDTEPGPSSPSPRTRTGPQGDGNSTTSSSASSSPEPDALPVRPLPTQLRRSPQSTQRFHTSHSSSEPRGRETDAIPRPRQEVYSNDLASNLRRRTPERLADTSSPPRREQPRGGTLSHSSRSREEEVYSMPRREFDTSSVTSRRREDEDDAVAEASRNTHAGGSSSAARSRRDNEQAGSSRRRRR